MMRVFSTSLFLALIGLSFACEDDADAPVSWGDDVHDLVKNNCTRCHTEGGVAPFAFETYEQVSASADIMLAAMKDGSMPPFPADEDCHPYANEKRLAAEDLRTFETWISEGKRLGPPREDIEIQRAEFLPTLVAQAATPYTPGLNVDDDYRCFLLDIDFDENTFVTGANIVPTAKAVHHVLVYALTGEQITHAETLENRFDEPGYQCFGGPLPPIPGGAPRSTDLFSLVSGWVPGAEARSFPEGLGLAIEAGTKLVMQIHYSAVGGDPTPDQTQVQLKLSNTPPDSLLRSVPLAVVDLDIPANERGVLHSKTFTNHSTTPVMIGAITPHMHLLGQSIDTTVVKSERGNDDQCGVSVSDWDFDWQLTYRMPDDQLLEVAPGEGVRLTCVYDNSAENQPVVDGQAQAPQNVSWGDGSLDEMCLAYITVIEPYVAPVETNEGAGACAASRECYAQSDGSLSALYACEETDSDCVLCSINAGFDCGLAPCAFSFNDVRSCIVDCVIATNAFGASIDECLENTCRTNYNVLKECSDPLLQSEECTQAKTDCGL